MINKILGLVILLSMSSSLEHKFYVSTTDIKFNSNSKTLQITIKLFTDDIETAINDISGVKNFLGTEKESKQADSFIGDYALSHFNIKTKNQEVELKFLGKEVDQDYTWVYMESNQIESPKRIEIRNTLLIDYFEEQSNKVNFENGRIKNSNSFHKDKIEGFIPQ